MVEVTIRNFSAYHGRREPNVKSQWFRMNHSIITDPEITELSVNERWLWIVLLATASRKNSAKVLMAPATMGTMCDLTEAEVLEALDKFLDPPREWITWHTVTADRDLKPKRIQRDGTAGPQAAHARAESGPQTAQEEEQIFPVLGDIATSTGTPLLQQIEPDRQQALIEKFGAAIVRHGAMDAAKWLERNPKRWRELKDKAAFLRNWLRKDVAEHGSTPTAKPKPKAAPPPPCDPIDNVELPLPGLKRGELPPWRKKANE